LQNLKGAETKLYTLKSGGNEPTKLSLNNLAMIAYPSFDLEPRDHAPNYSIPIDLCTLQTCPITRGQPTYDPSFGGNVFFASLFGLLLTIQLLLGIYYRTWTYSIGLVCGVTLELCGNIGRIQMHFNPLINSPFFT
jgi:hypothetical protein